MVDSGGGTPEQRPALINAATQLNYVTHNYRAAGRYGAMLDKPDDKTMLMIADSYLQLKDNANAAKSAQAIVDADKAAGKVPSSDVLSIPAERQRRLGNHGGATAAVDQLADVSSNPQVWRMVTAQVLGGGYSLSNHQVINLLRLRLATGSMDETDYVALAATDIQVGLPQEAKDALQQGIDKGQISNSGRIAQLMQQANAAIPADQKALPQLQKIADTSKSGDPDVQYGESLYTYGRNDEAISRVEARHIMKGVVERPRRRRAHPGRGSVPRPQHAGCRLAGLRRCRRLQGQRPCRPHLGQMGRPQGLSRTIWKLQKARAHPRAFCFAPIP